jgi:endo-1,4-beta-xylanase
LDEVEPRRFVDDFAEPDSALGWAEAHRMPWSGVALLWGEHAPAWFSAIDDRRAAMRAITDHVTRVCRHFAGRVHSWEVVNEAIQVEHKRPDGLRRNPYLERTGPEYLDIAFHAAREADPKAMLFYNDFDVELDTPRHARRRDVLLRILDGFRDRGTPIDMVGLQSHLATERMSQFDEKLFEKLLQDLADRGLAIMLSELDVIDKGAPSDTERRDAAVAAAYRRYLDVALANRAVKFVVTWGITDRDSWITKGTYPETRRADGLAPRPLPFDTNDRPKPAYAALAAAFKAAPSR